MLDDLILHGLSFELVRVISNIGKKTDWPSVATALSVFFSQLLPLQSEKCIPSFTMAMEYSVLKSST